MYWRIPVPTTTYIHTYIHTYPRVQWWYSTSLPSNELGPVIIQDVTWIRIRLLGKLSKFSQAQGAALKCRVSGWELGEHVSR